MSAAAPHRILIELGQAMAEGDGIEAAALLARLLGHELRGVFVEDEALLTLAAHPFARELRLPSHAWGAMDAAALAAGLGLAAARLERALAAACARLGVEGGFEVRRGDPAACLAGLCGADDILALAAPDSAAGRAIGAFPRAWRAALATAGGVLLLPPRLARRHGPVVAVAGSAMGEEVALRLAVAAGEPLLLLSTLDRPATEAALADRAHRAGLVPPRILTRRLAAPTAGAVAEALGRFEEGVLVLSREDAAVGEGPAIVARRRVPVLVR